MYDYRLMFQKEIGEPVYIGNHESVEPVNVGDIISVRNVFEDPAKLVNKFWKVEQKLFQIKQHPSRENKDPSFSDLYAGLKNLPSIILLLRETSEMELVFS